MSTNNSKISSAAHSKGKKRSMKLSHRAENERSPETSTSETRSGVHESEHHAQNHSAPIHTLPIELLSKIFLLALLPPDSWKLDRMRELASVCSWWREAIKQTPLLWTNIDSDEMLSTRLLRTKGLPLYITFNYNVKNIMSSKSIQLLPREARRWESFTYCGTQALFKLGLKRVLRKNLPQLRSLTIKLRPQYGVTPVGVRLSSAPQLETLVMSKVHFGDDFCRLPKLRYLSFTNIYVPSRGAVNLKSVLGGFEALEELVLKDLEGQSRSAGEGLDMGCSLKFANLTRLVIDDVDEAISLVTLHDFEAPNLTSLEYKAVDLHDELFDYSPLITDTNLPQLLAATLRNLPRKSATIEVNNKHLALTAGSHDVLLSLTYADRLQEVVRRLVRRCSFEGFDIDLHVDAKNENGNCTCWRLFGLPKKFFPVRRLYIDGASFWYSLELCHRLSVPTSLGAGTARWWMLGALEEVQFQAEMDEDYFLGFRRAVKRMLDARHSAIDVPPDDGVRPPLRRLTVFYNRTFVFNEFTTSFEPIL